MNPNSDAIIVLGGGVREGGELPSWVRRRLDRAIELYRGQPILCTSAGTTHRPPPLDNAGLPIFESTAAAAYLIDSGIPAELVLRETCSYDTIGNAYFCRTIHAEPRRLRRLIVITSDFHLSRSEAVFNWVFGLEPQSIDYDLRFEGVTDPSVVPQVLRFRTEKERASLLSVQALASRIRTLPDFHRWLFSEHGAYRAQPVFRASLDGLTVESY